MEKKLEMVQLLMSREKVEDLARQKMEKKPVENVFSGQMQMTLANILSAKMLLSQVGLEKAKEVTEKVIYDYCYNLGREAAKKLGNPTDLDSYLRAYAIVEMDAIPVVPAIEIVEKTKNRCVWGVKDCQYKDSIKKLGDAEPGLIDTETMEILKARCIHDIAWANGFNPKMKCNRIQFMLDGDEGCFFESEVSE